MVELNGRLNKCGVISPRFDVGVKDIEPWTARLLPSRQVCSSISFLYLFFWACYLFNEFLVYYNYVFHIWHDYSAVWVYRADNISRHHGS